MRSRRSPTERSAAVRVPRGLGEHHGGNDPPDSWQEPEDREVTVLVLPLARRLARCEQIEQPVERRRALTPLSNQARRRRGSESATCRGSDVTGGCVSCFIDSAMK